MGNMVLSTITSGELTERQTEKVNEVCKTFGESYKSLASVFVRYAELNDKIDVAFCDYVHHALEKLSTSKIKNKNKIFAEMTGVEYTKVTKCNKVYTDVMTAVKLSTANDMGYNTVSDVFTEYSFSQLYTLTAIQCGATIEKLIKRNIHNYTVAEIRFIIENIKAKNPIENIVDDEIAKRVHYIGQGLDIKKFNDYIWNDDENCYEAKNDSNSNDSNNDSNSNDSNNDSNSNDSNNDSNSNDSNSNDSNNDSNSNDSNNDSNSNDSNDSNSNSNDSNSNSNDSNSNSNENTLDINAILDYIRACENPLYLNSIKVATTERLKAIKK